jgi:hypothetical protein
MFFLLLVQKMLVGDGDRNLGFDLKQLVLHVEDKLSRQLLGIFGLRDEVVDVGS